MASGAQRRDADLRADKIISKAIGLNRRTKFTLPEILSCLFAVHAFGA
jgi:hypothetical protein